MSKQILINHSEITTVVSRPAKLSQKYKWFEEHTQKQNWFQKLMKKPLVIEPSGFYDIFSDGDIWDSNEGKILVSSEEILSKKKYKIERKVVLIKDQLVLTMSDGNTHNLYFKNEIDCNYLKYTLFLNKETVVDTFLDITNYVDQNG